MNDHSWDHDVAVIGGGPAGSAVAALLARKGRRVVVLERERFPRFHVGESMLPMSAAALRELGVAERIERAGFTPKHGATFVDADGSRDMRIDFASSPEVPDPVTFHAARAELDALLLDHARESGAEVRQGVRVREARFDADGVDVIVEGADGATRTERVGFVLDASGRHGFLARRMGLRVGDPELRKVALFAHFEGTPGDAAPPGDIRIVTGDDLSWWWMIPLRGRISVGLVFDAGADPRRRGETAEDTLARRIAETPYVARALDGRPRVGPARCEGDFSYSTRAYGGERFLLLGDAGAFLDPVFSTGVDLALKGAVDGAAAVDRALAAGTTLAGAGLRAFTRRQRRRYRYFRRFVTAFYTHAFRDTLYQAGDWPRTTRAIVTALAGNDRPRLGTRLLLAWVFVGLALRERQARRPSRSARTGVPAPVQTGTH